VPATGTSSALDATRVEQFLALQRDLLLGSGDPATLPDRLAQSVALFLGVRGAAVSSFEDGGYRVLGTYGVGAGYLRRYEGTSLGGSELAPALAGGRPIVLIDADGDTILRTVVLPFRVGESSGALHLVVEESATLSDERLELARMLAGLSAVALGNARQYARLARLARLKGDALATMAHDLRSPLNALVGYAALLAEGAFGALSGEQRDVAAALERQALEVVDLLRATLDVARLETGRLPLRVEEFALADVVTTLATGTFAGPSRDGRISWSVPPDLPLLRTDRVKVKEVLQNLLDNALKHGAGGAVSLDVAATAAGQAVRITVRNGGAAIAPDLLPTLFEPFRPGRGDAPGTGFGLYIVRSFAEALGGGVAVRSESTGTAFTVDLPVDAPAR
jgi:signal transduction histidine kinase